MKDTFLRARRNDERYNAEREKCSSSYAAARFDHVLCLYLMSEVSEIGLKRALKHTLSHIEKDS